MKTANEKTHKESVTIAILASIVLLIGMFSIDIGFLLRFVLFMSLVFSFVAGFMGSTRRIGFGPAFLWSFLLSPIVGFIITLNSPTLADEEYKEKMLEASDTTSAAMVADQLYKLNELRKEGILTDDEFHAQKEKLLGM